MHFMFFFYFRKESHDFFVDISSFSVISGSFVQHRRSTSFDAIPHDAQNQIRICSSHIAACSDKVW